MNEYITPELDIYRFEAEDVITTSNIEFPEVSLEDKN